MRFSKVLIISFKFIIILIMFFSCDACLFAQLKKKAKVENVRSFTNGSVALNKTTLDGIEVYSVTLPNNSKYHQPIIFFLGSKDEMIKNLYDLSTALEKGEKGEVFDFSACGKNYQLSFGRILGQKCFKIWEPINTSKDYGCLFKATIDDILEFLKNSND